MATYNAGEDYSAATFEDILVDGWGDSLRIIGETPRGHGWIVQSLKHDNIRRVVMKDTPERRARVVYAQES